MIGAKVFNYSLLLLVAILGGITWYSAYLKKVEDDKYLPITEYHRCEKLLSLVPNDNDLQIKCQLLAIEAETAQKRLVLEHLIKISKRNYH